MKRVYINSLTVLIATTYGYSISEEITKKIKENYLLSDTPKQDLKAEKNKKGKYSKRSSLSKKSLQDKQKKIFALIDQELLKLLLNTFLAKSDLENAYDVARKGLELFPDSIYWLEMYAKICLWTSRTGEAYYAYEKIFQKDPSKNNLENFFKMSIATNRFDKAAELLLNYPELSFSVKDIKDIVYIFTQAGNIEELIGLLRRKYEKDQDPDILYQIAYTSYNYGDLENALNHMMELEKKRELNLKEILLYADILYAYKKPHRAFKVLKDRINIIEKLSITEDDQQKRDIVRYYEYLSDLGWYTKDFDAVVYASKKLETLGSARLVDYIRLYTVYYNRKNFQLAQKYAEKGFEKYQDKYLFSGYIESLNQQGKWRDIIKVIGNVDKSFVLKDSYITAIYIKALSKEGKRQKALKVIKEALETNFSEEVLAEAIFFSIDSKDQLFAKYIITKYKNYENKLSKQFAILYLFLQNSSKAMSLIKKNPIKTKEDYLLYADILSLSGRQQEALKIKYDIYKSIVKDKKFFEDPSKIELLLRAGMEFLPEETLKKLFIIAKKKLSPDSYSDIYLSYLALKGENDRILYIKNIHRKHLSPWLQLNLALWSNDKFWQKEVLSLYDDILPIRDRVESLKRTGQIKLSMEYAYKGLEENPEDTLLYKQFRDLVNLYSSKADITFSYSNWDKVSSLATNGLFRYYLQNGVYLNYEFTTIKPIQNESKIYTNLTDINFNKISVSKINEDGSMEIGFSLINSEKQNFGALFKYSSNIDSKTSVNFSISTNQLSYESVYMLYGGMKDSYSLSVSNSINSRSSILISGIYDKYKSQDGKTIGDSKTLYTEGIYKLRIGYPDYTFRVYMQNSNFNEKNVDKGIINKISSIQNPDVLPQSFTLLGFGFLFGFDNKDNYNRVLRPFFSTDIMYNTVAGLSYGFSIGVGGTVFRKDNLSAGFRYQKDFRGTGTPYSELFVKYMIFF